MTSEPAQKTCLNCGTITYRAKSESWRDWYNREFCNDGVDP